MSYGHTIYWGMAESKSDNKSEQSLVYILSQFSIKSDHRSSHKFWILNSIYQNDTTSTLYYYIWLPLIGIQIWRLHIIVSFAGDQTMLIFHKKDSLTNWLSKKLHVIVWCINHLQLYTSYYTTRIRFCTNNSCHWSFVSSSSFL